MAVNNWRGADSPGQKKFISERFKGSLAFAFLNRIYRSLFVKISRNLS
jgi:hypothetical protein